VSGRRWRTCQAQTRSSSGAHRQRVLLAKTSPPTQLEQFQITVSLFMHKLKDARL